VWVKPSKATIAKLWDQYRIYFANKTNRIAIPAEQSVSYAFNPKFTLVERVMPREPFIPASPHIVDTKVTDHSSDMDVTGTETQTKTPTTPLRSPSASPTPQYGALSLSQLGDKEPALKTNLIEDLNAASFEHLLEKSTAFQRFIEEKLQHAVNDRMRDLESKKEEETKGLGTETLPIPTPSTSSRYSINNQEGQALIMAMSAKEAAQICLDSVESNAIERWGNRVIDFEKKYPTIP
jgi:hypothetical protein